MQGTLETIARTISNITSEIDAAARSMDNLASSTRNYANALSSANSAASKASSSSSETLKTFRWSNGKTTQGNWRDFWAYIQQNTNPYDPDKILATYQSGKGSITGTYYHDGTDYVVKKRTPYDDLLGIKDNETMAILEVGERVISKEDNMSAAFNPDMIKTSTYISPPAMQSVSTDNSIGGCNIDVGGIVIQGSATPETAQSIVDGVVDQVFERITQGYRTSGHRNLRVAGPF